MSLPPIKRRLMRDPSGSVLIEFAIALPVLLILLFGALELNRYIAVLQRLDKTAYTVADVITRTPAYDASDNTGLTRESLETTLDYFDELMTPYPVAVADGGEGAIVVTSVYEDTDPTTPPQIMWQVSGGSGTLSVAQAISAVTGSSVTDDRRLETVNFSSDILSALATTESLPSAGSQGMMETENMIVVEVFYRYVPLFNTFFADVGDSGTLIERRAYFTPRVANEKHLDLGPDLCCYPNG